MYKIDTNLYFVLLLREFTYKNYLITVLQIIPNIETYNFPQIQSIHNEIFSFISIMNWLIFVHSNQNILKPYQTKINKIMMVKVFLRPLNSSTWLVEWWRRMSRTWDTIFTIGSSGGLYCCMNHCFREKILNKTHIIILLFTS